MSATRDRHHHRLRLLDQLDRAEFDIQNAELNHRRAIRTRNYLLGALADEQLLEGDPPLAAIHALALSAPNYGIRNKFTEAAAPPTAHRIYWWGLVAAYVRCHTDDELLQVRNVGERSITKLRAWAARMGGRQ